MRFRTVVKIGVGLSVLLFCVGVAFYSFLSLTDAEKGKDINMFALIPDDCNGVLDTDNIGYYTSEFPRTSYAIDLDTLHHSELINNILTDITKYTSVNTHGLSNQIKRLMISFHDSTPTKDVVAYFNIAGGGNKFAIDVPDIMAYLEYIWNERDCRLANVRLFFFLFLVSNSRSFQKITNMRISVQPLMGIYHGQKLRDARSSFLISVRIYLSMDFLNPYCGDLFCCGR